MVLVADPVADAQALKEASEIKVPVIALAGSDSPMANTDLVVPANNKGRKSLALLYYLLSRETLVERKEISREGFTAQVSDFEQEIDEAQEEKSRRSFAARTGFRSGGMRPRRPCRYKFFFTSFKHQNFWVALPQKSSQISPLFMF